MIQMKKEINQVAVDLELPLCNSLEEDFFLKRFIKRFKISNYTYVT